MIWQVETLVRVLLGLRAFNPPKTRGLTNGRSKSVPQQVDHQRRMETWGWEDMIREQMMELGVSPSNSPKTNPAFQQYSAPSDGLMERYLELMEKHKPQSTAPPQREPAAPEIAAAPQEPVEAPVEPPVPQTGEGTPQNLNVATEPIRAPEGLV